MAQLLFFQACHFFIMGFCLHLPSAGLVSTLICHVLVFPCQDKCSWGSRDCRISFIHKPKLDQGFKFFFCLTDLQCRFHEPLMTLSTDYCFSHSPFELQLVVLARATTFLLLEVLISACVFQFVLSLSALCDCLGRSCSLTNPSNR